MDGELDRAKQRLYVNELMDCYAPLLTKKQRDTMALYFGDDLSLSEISDLLGISRQGVLDTVHRSIRILTQTEEQLGFLKKEKQYDRLTNAVRTLAKDDRLPATVREELQQLIGDGTHGI